MFATRLSEPAVASHGVITARVNVVHASMNVRYRDFSPRSRLVVALELEAPKGKSGIFPIDELRMAMIDESGQRQTRWPIASGLGEPPLHLRDAERVPMVPVIGGQKTQAWVAFGDFSERRTRELPQRVILEIPDESRLGRKEMVLSDPGRPPVWQAEPVTLASGAALSVQVWPRGVALNMFGSESRHLLDPFWVGYGWAVGLRLRELGGSRVDAVNFDAHASLGHVLVRGPEASLSLYGGGEAAVELAERRAGAPGSAVGPVLGLSLMVAPLLPRHGPLPISYGASVLGSVQIDAGLAWWFGQGLEAHGEPGMVLRFGYLGGR